MTDLHVSQIVTLRCHIKKKTFCFQLVSCTEWERRFSHLNNSQFWTSVDKMMCIDELIKDVDLSTEDGITEVCAKINRLNVSKSSIENFDFKKEHDNKIYAGKCQRAPGCSTISSMSHRVKDEWHWSCLIWSNTSVKRLQKFKRND